MAMASSTSSTSPCGVVASTPSMHGSALLLSVAASASPIVVPKQLELAVDSGGANESPAIATTGNPLAPPSVSPLPGSCLYTSRSDSLYDDGSSMEGAEGDNNKIKGTTKSQAGMNGGRWTEQEHQSFLAGLRMYGREWKKVASKIKTRTSAQIRSHAQKYFAKLARDDETRRHGGGGSGSAMGGDASSLASGLDGGSSLLFSGYMSDDGSSNSAGNLSGDDSNDTEDSSSSRSQQQQQQQQQHAYPSSSSSSSTPQRRPSSLLPVHPFPSPPSLQPASVAGLFHSRGALLVPLKKRSRPSMAAIDMSPSPSHCSSSMGLLSFKQRKTCTTPLTRLPSAEELVETVSPTVRQRLSSLVDAEICALQVLSCYTWLQQQQQQPQQQQPSDLKVHMPLHSLSLTPSHSHSTHRAASPATSASGSSMSLTMISADRATSIF